MQLLPAPVVERTGARVLLWDSRNSSSIVMAQGFRAAGWTVDWLVAPGSPSEVARREGESCALVARGDDVATLAILNACRFDALTLHGDDQLRFVLERWNALPGLHRFLPDRDALSIALSKVESMEIAKRLGIAVLESEVVDSPGTAAKAASRLAARGTWAVLKGEGGSAGSTVRRLRAGTVPAEAEWNALTARSPRVIVQRAIAGPRMLVTGVWDRGRACASVTHEKVAAWPPRFGITAAGVTRHEPEVQRATERLLFTLAWQGLANVELRQDETNGRWCFMEINPRVPSSVGIQQAAGVDLARTWAAVCAGQGPRVVKPGYREGVRFTWAVPATAAALRAPWTLPAWAAVSALRGGDDLRSESGVTRTRARSLAVWKAFREAS